MKRLYVILFVLAAGLISCGRSDDKKDGGKDSQKTTISMSGAFALYPLAVRWAEEYSKVQPGITFDIQAGGAGKGMADALSGMIDCGMVSRSLLSEELRRGAWPVTVARDAVVPTCHAENPYAVLLNSRGVTRQQFRDIWVGGSIKTWGRLLNNSAAEQIQVFTRSDAAGAPETWARYLGSHQENLQGIGVFGDPGVAESVAQHKLALGYNNVNYVYDISTRRPFPGLMVVPIDLDSNGVLDGSEQFYGHMDSLNAAVQSGRFPSPPARELYFVFNGKPGHPAVKDFLRWVLTEGQKYVPASGYVPMEQEQLQVELKKLE